MAKNTVISETLLESALAANPMIERFYVAGGGSAKDLRTDMASALAFAVQHHGWDAKPEPQVNNVINITNYHGPDRRDHRGLAARSANWDGVERRHAV